MYKPQVTISLNEPLALDKKRKISCLILAIAHLTLGANLLSIYAAVFPVMLLPIVVIIALLEKKRQKPLAQRALKQLWRRIILHIIAIAGALIMQSTLPAQINPLAPWNLLIFTLIPLSIYDAFQVAEGKTGLNPSLLRK